MLEKHKLVVEAAGAVSLAALEPLNLRSRKFAEAKGPHVVVPIMSGGNEDTVSIGAVIQKGMIRYPGTAGEGRHIAGRAACERYRAGSRPVQGVQPLRECRGFGRDG